MDKVVCYYWSRSSTFVMRNFDPTLCTHLIYAYASIEEDGSFNILNPSMHTENFQRFNDLKQENPKLKTLISVGNFEEDSIKYFHMASDHQKRSKFIATTLDFLQINNFDGLELGWNLSSLRRDSVEMENYVTLLKEITLVWNKHEGLLLTAAVGPSSSYDVPTISLYLDFLNVMTHDLYQPTSVTTQNAPLYSSSVNIRADQRLLNVSNYIYDWIKSKAPLHKIVLGLATFGRSYTLIDANNHNLGAAVTGISKQIGYNEICELQLNGGWTIIWDAQQKTPYTYKEKQWVGYDDPASIAVKVEFAKSLKLGGVAVWSIDMDDFNGITGVTFPILKEIQSVLEKERETCHCQCRWCSDKSGTLERY